MSDTDTDLRPVVDHLLGELARHWNARDSAGFAERFHADAEFVDVLGRVFRGRRAIADIHRKNFDTIHAGSHLHMSALDAHLLADGVVLAHSQAAMRVPAGPLAGDSRATQTMVLCAEDGGAGWSIRAFHNTFVREMPGVPAP